MILLRCLVYNALTYCLLLDVWRWLMLDLEARMVGGSWLASRRGACVCVCVCVSHGHCRCWQRAVRARSLHATAAHLLIAACQDLSSAQLYLLSQTAFQLNCLSRHWHSYLLLAIVSWYCVSHQCQFRFNCAGFIPSCPISVSNFFVSRHPVSFLPPWNARSLLHSY
jgi:hypothetical protein